MPGFPLVTPTKVGVQLEAAEIKLDSGFRRNDDDMVSPAVMMNERVPRRFPLVTPTKVGVQLEAAETSSWIPAFAGMTMMW